MAGFPFISPIEVPQSGVSNNLGVFAVAALDHPDKTRGKYIDVRSDLLTFIDVLKVWFEVTGKVAVYINIPPEEFSKIWGPAGVQMSMQYQSGELWGDCEKLKGDLVIQPAEIGVSKDQLIDLKGDLTKLKGKLL